MIRVVAVRRDRRRGLAPTRLIACSHVSWVGGRVVDAPALAATGVPVLLDAAQALGAVPVDVRALGVRLLRRLGPEVAVRPRGERLPVRSPRPARGAARAVARVRLGRRSAQRARVRAQAEGAARLRPRLPGRRPQRVGDSPRWACSRRRAGMGARARRVDWRRGSPARWPSEGWRSGRVAARRSSLGRRGPESRGRARSPARASIVRSIPAFGLVRASVGAWTSEEELDRLVLLAGHA